MNKINNSYEYFNESKEYQRLSELIQSVKIVNSSRADKYDSEYEKYLVTNNGEHLYILVAPKIEHNPNDKYIFISKYSCFPTESKYNNALIMDLFAERLKNKADGLLLPLDFFEELDPDYPYTNEDIIKILKIEYIAPRICSQL